MDRSTRTADAWRILWHLTADGPVRWATAVAVMAEAHPTLARKTVALIPYKAVAARLLTKRGGYSHKTGRDTRTVERRHPDPTEHQ